MTHLELGRLSARHSDVCRDFDGGDEKKPSDYL
jgi:hypothetical protein